MNEGENWDSWNRVFGSIVMLYFLTIILPAVLLHRLGIMKNPDVVIKPLCWVGGHSWADEQRYGVEPVCLDCGKRRE